MTGAIKKTIKKKIYSLERSWLADHGNHLRRPEFLYIGSGQVGNTWLFRNLQKHPGTFVTGKKETHYFSYAFDEWSFKYYCSLFEEAGDRVGGELTPAYMLLTPERIAQVRKLVPDARLIMTIRDPIERSWSGALRTLGTIAKKEGITLDDIPDNEFFEFFEKEWAYRPGRNPVGEFIPGMLQGFYTRAIDNWLEHFPQEQLLITYYEHVKTQPQQFLMDVCKHIGASTDIDWSTLPLFEVVNKNVPRELPDKYRHRLNEIYQDEIKELRHRFGHELFSGTGV